MSAVDVDVADDLAASGARTNMEDDSAGVTDVADDMACVVDAFATMTAWQMTKRTCLSGI